MRDDRRFARRHRLHEIPERQRLQAEQHRERHGELQRPARRRTPAEDEHDRQQQAEDDPDRQVQQQAAATFEDRVHQFLTSMPLMTIDAAHDQRLRRQHAGRAPLVDEAAHERRHFAGHRPVGRHIDLDAAPESEHFDGGRVAFHARVGQIELDAAHDRVEIGAAKRSRHRPQLAARHQRERAHELGMLIARCRAGSSALGGPGQRAPHQHAADEQQQARQQQLPQADVHPADLVGEDPDADRDQHPAPCAAAPMVRVAHHRHTDATSTSGHMLRSTWRASNRPRLSHSSNTPSPMMMRPTTRRAETRSRCSCWSRCGAEPPVEFMGSRSMSRGRLVWRLWSHASPARWQVRVRVSPVDDDRDRR